MQHDSILWSRFAAVAAFDSAPQVCLFDFHHEKLSPDEIVMKCAQLILKRFDAIQKAYPELMDPKGPTKRPD